MDTDEIRRSRRAFFLRGGAVLGAGVATAAGAGTLEPASTAPADEVAKLRAALDAAADRESIRALQAQFLHAIGQQDYVAAARLFADDASLALSGVEARGRAAIEHAFTTQYGAQRAAILHGAYRDVAALTDESLAFSPDRREARARLSGQVELCTPLTATCTAAQMARLQGQMAERRWEAGRFDARYVRSPEGWRFGSLRWSATA